MTKKKKRTKNYSRYPVELKRKIAKSYLAGEASYRILAEENGLKNRDVVKEFVRWYQRNYPGMEESKNLPQGSTDREKELEEQLRLAKLKIEMLETMFDVAEEELNIQIRKKSGSNQLKR